MKRLLSSISMFAVSALLATALVAQTAPASTKKEVKTKSDTTVVKKGGAAHHQKGNKESKTVKQNSTTKENKTK